MKSLALKIRCAVLGLTMCVCLMTLSGCSGNGQKPSTSVPVKITVEATSKPQANLIDYSPCLVPEDTPVLLNKYPTYAEQLFSTIDECNQRNALNNQRNRRFGKERGSRLLKPDVTAVSFFETVTDVKVTQAILTLTASISLMPMHISTSKCQRTITIVYVTNTIPKRASRAPAFQTVEKSHDPPA